MAEVLAIVAMMAYICVPAVLLFLLIIVVKMYNQLQEIKKILEEKIGSST